MITGFLDESGTLLPDGNHDAYTIALLVAPDPKRIEVLIRRLRHSLHRKARTSELKASQSHPRVVRRVLDGLTALECEMFALVVDTTGMDAREGEVVYRAAIASVIRRCVERHPDIHLYLDKRYTKHSQRIELERIIREGIAHIPEQVVLIDQVDSRSSPGLQAVDFVAWAIEQKHTINEYWGYRIIAGKIVSEEKILGIKIAAWPGDR